LIMMWMDRINAQSESGIESSLSQKRYTQHQKKENKMKNTKSIPILILLSFFLGCEDTSQKEELNPLLGSWNSQFEYEYRPDIVIEGVADTSMIRCTAEIEFLSEVFTINVSPPVPSQLWWHGARSQWFGDYDIREDTIYFSAADSSTLADPYLFEISGDTLFLSMVYMSDESGIMLVSVGGGLPWGYAGRIHSGWFLRKE